MAEGLETYGYEQLPDYVDYVPQDFKRAEMPTGLQQFGDTYGAQAVRIPMSFGSFHPVNKIPEIEKLKQVNPELIQAEKNLYENQEAEAYRQRVAKLNDIAKQAASNGFDVNRPNILDKNQMAIYQTYKNHLNEVKDFVAKSQEVKKQYDELQKQAAKGEGRFVPQFYENRLDIGQQTTPTPQQLQYGFEKYGQLPQVKAFNEQYPRTASSLSTTGRIAEKERKALQDTLLAQKEEALAAGDIATAEQIDKQLIAKTGISYEDAQKLSLERQKAGKALEPKVKLAPANATLPLSSGNGTVKHSLVGHQLTYNSDKDGAVTAIGGQYIDSNSKIIKSTKDTYTMLPKNVGVQFVYGRGTKVNVLDGKGDIVKNRYLTGGETLKTFSTPEQILEYINKATPEELKQIKPVIGVHGRIVDPASVYGTTESTPEGGMTREQREAKSINKTVTKSIPLENYQKDPLLVQINENTDGRLFQDLFSEGTLEKRILDAYNAKVQGGKQKNTNLVGDNNVLGF